jgi:hypothetical protein
MLTKNGLKLKYFLVSTRKLFGINEESGGDPWDKVKEHKDSKKSRQKLEEWENKTKRKIWNLK